MAAKLFNEQELNRDKSPWIHEQPKDCTVNSPLTQDEFQHQAIVFLSEKVVPLLQSKGAQYSRKGAFDNFVEGAAINHVDPENYLMIQATKHWHNLCKNPRGNVTERCTDIIVYMLLLTIMNEEKNGAV